MYVTRRLSELLKYPESVSELPEGPNSGYLVIQDEESETYSCFGLCKNRTLKELPFPQNKELTIRYRTSTGESQHVSSNPVFFIPVLNQPLSSNRYYAIDPHGKHKGEAFTCSTEEDKITCCFCRCVSDVKPKRLDPQNMYQQFEIVPYEGICTSGYYFTSKSILSDGFPPRFLRQQHWQIDTKTPKHFKLGEARGLDHTLRVHLPELNLDPSQKSCVPVLIGKWYCPFTFVKEGPLREQVERSMYYEVMLERRWEQVFRCEKNKYDSKENCVLIDASVEIEEVFISGNKAVWSEKDVGDGVIWFTSYVAGGQQISMGLRVEVFQRMKWEQERAGWRSGEGRLVNINRVEEFNGIGDWREFGCFVLVERFNFLRMDGSLAIAHDFKHFHQVRAIWE